jgi:acyl CoA:acetate/3-ketoacid CoA transferase alpha subunit
MANVAASAVTVLRSYYSGGLHGKDYITKQVTIVLAAQGNLTNTIPAAALGFALMVDCGNLVKSDNSAVVQAGISPDGSILLAADDAGAAGLTGTFTVTVVGVPLATY